MTILLKDLRVVNGELRDQGSCTIVDPIIVLKNAQFVFQLRNLTLHLQFISAATVRSDVAFVRICLALSFRPAIMTVEKVLWFDTKRGAPKLIFCHSCAVFRDEREPAFAVSSVIFIESSK